MTEKKRKLDRRDFLTVSAAAAAGMSLATHAQSASTASAQTAPDTRKWLKGVKIGMLPKELSPEEKFALAKKCGFDGIDGTPVNNMKEARRLADLAKRAGCPFHGIVFGGWHAPLSDPDPEVQKKGVDGMKTALRCANAMGVDTVLLVPAIVKSEVPYGDAYERSQENVRKLLPLAEEMNVIIGIENVWNKFLLSPLEFARYIDEFESPWVRAYFDIGNVIIHGYSQDWIRTLGKRIVKLDVKDFKRNGYKWTNLRDGDVEWPEVVKALDEIGYRGWMTCELRGGDESYLADVAKRMDWIIAGAKS
jgi:hexulose-6-phosphate isomerase